MMKIVFALVAVFAAFTTSTGLAFTHGAPSRQPCRVSVPDAPVAVPSIAAESKPTAQLAAAPVKVRAAKSAPAKRSTRVYRCETRQLQMGTYGDTVQDCYWHDR